jgi:predicted MFS family arabinose efflux permease
VNGSPSASTAALPAQRERWTVLTAMLVMYFFSFFQRAAIPGTMFNEIQTDMHLTAAAVTALAALFTYVYGGAQLFVGITVDRLGGVRTLLVGGGVMTVGAALFPLSTSPAMLYFSRILTALGSSVMYLSIVKEICLRFSPQRFAILVAVMLVIGYSGGMAGMLPCERLVALCGWRPALLGIAALMAFALFVAWRILRRLDRFQPAQRHFSLSPLGEVLRNRHNLPILLIASINFPIYFTIQTIFGKKFLQDFAGLSSSTAATFTTIMIVTTAGCMLAASLLLPWTGHRRKPWILLAGGFLLGATALLLWGTVYRAGGWAFLVAYLLMAAAMLSTPAITATMKELNPPESVALAIAVMNALSYLGAGVVGNLGGVILDRFTNRAQVTPTGTQYPPEAYTAVFVVLLVLAIVSMISVYFVRETKGRTRQSPDEYRRTLAEAGALGD